MPPPANVKVGACHASPIYLNASATVAKAGDLIAEAAKNGAQLVAFPEVFIPGFPLYAGTRAPVDHGTLFTDYCSASIYADGPEIALLRDKAKELGVCVSMGFSERSRHSSGSLWNSNVIISESGEILSHHRKLAPTFWEKLVWSSGDGYGLRVCDTEKAGRVGMLICGENTNPLARYSMMAQAEQIHLCSFPPAWPTARDGGYKNKTANATRAAAHSFEAKCFSAVCAAFLSKEMKEKVSAGDVEVAKILKKTPQASTQFFGPDAVQIGDELTDEEGIAYAEFDLAKCVEAKKLHDVVGGYQRYDVFDLRVTRKRDEPVEWR